MGLGGGFLRGLRGVPWRTISGEALDRAFFVAKFLCCLHVTNTYIGGLALVYGPSMLPTINLTGDILLVEKVSVRLDKIKRGDVVLVRSPENPRKIVTKRITGLEGDEVTYLPTSIGEHGSRTITVPEGHVWIQGDNLYASNDSRHFGSVPYGLITGRVFCRIWPINGFGSLGEGD
ncbi:unnamed protein product [Victoria cruziana]